MNKKVPKHISSQYEKGGHGFRSEKRQQLRYLKKVLDNFRTGCAYFPCGTVPVDNIEEQVAILQQSLSVKTWGR